MTVTRLVAYLCIALWIGGLAAGFEDLLREGSWLAAIPLSLVIAASLSIAWFIRRDRREGRLR